MVKKITECAARVSADCVTAYSKIHDRQYNSFAVVVLDFIAVGQRVSSNRLTIARIGAAQMVRHTYSLLSVVSRR